MTAARASDAVRVGVRGTFLVTRNPSPQYFIGDAKDLPLAGPILNRIDLVAAEGEVNSGLL